MKDSIQNKINKIQEIALASASEKRIVDDRHVTESNYSDNLTKSIRNKKEAELFFSELKSVIDQAKKNSRRNVLE
ncbi:hypothetical protein RB619_05045 [Flavobacterium sp. LHD-80]|uniref:hypothetical protein n=1 Tax=Flavobacterium sp. LHD-80 TaxID=3071411 RepID=UPI0027E1D32D|nr:hypothetical protein [Flavobacterium sp. LHD-80]MDQ6470003.1 hypothetical protein [Flavobacterium sp. LHD-80]